MSHLVLFLQWDFLRIFQPITVFENHKKCRIWILTISINFCPFRNDLSGNTVRPQASGFQKLAKIDPFGIFNELLSTQNVNVARFARNVDRDFFYDFLTLWSLCFKTICPSVHSTTNIFFPDPDLYFSACLDFTIFSMINSVWTLPFCNAYLSVAKKFLWRRWSSSCAAHAEHSVWKSQKKSHSTLRAKRAKFTS